MKKLILFLIILSVAVSAHAKGAGMPEFRLEQRRLVLADFKALYKQRHLSSHKAQLHYKHSRVKKLTHSTVLRHRYKPSLQENMHNAEAGITASSDVSRMHFENAMIQTQANHDMDLVTEGGIYKIGAGNPTGSGGGYVPADTGSISVGGGGGDFEPVDGGSNPKPPDMGDADNGSGTNNSGPGSTGTDTDQGFTSDGGAGSGNGGTADSETDTSSVPYGTNSESGPTETGGQGVRPLYANPWGRR